MSEFEDIDFSASVADEAQPVVADEFGGIDFSTQSEISTDKPKGDGFIERTAPQLSERNQRIASDFKSLINLETRPDEALFNAAGEIAGSIVDVLGEGLVSAGRGVAEITPDFIKEPVSEAAEFTVEQFQTALRTDVGQAGLKAMQSGIGNYRDYKEKNPRTARLLENFVNIAVVFAPAKVKAKSKPSLLTKTSDKVKAAADKQIAGDRNKFIQGLIGPVRDLRTLRREVPRTLEIGKGPLKRSIVEPTKIEAAIAQEVAKIKGVSAKKSVQGNWNVISAENKQLAIQLAADVKRAKIKIPQQSVLQQIDDVIDEAVSSNMFIVGTGEQVGEKFRRTVAKVIIKHADGDGFIKGENLLAARKELDAVIKSQKPGVFNENTAESAVEVIAKATRNAMNDILDKSVPISRLSKAKPTRILSGAEKREFVLGTRNMQLRHNLKVKEELKRQSLLFSALDNMTPKAATEANHAIVRAVQNAMKVVPIRNEAVQLLAMSAGVGGLGAAAMAAPKVRTAGAIAATIFATYKGAKSPGLKKIVAGTLKLTDEAIRTTKDPSMIKALRADRALIVELLEKIEEEQ